MEFKCIIEGKIIDLGSSIRTVVEKLVELTNPVISPLFNALPDRPLEKTRIAKVQQAKRLIKWSLESIWMKASQEPLNGSPKNMNNGKSQTNN